MFAGSVHLLWCSPTFRADVTVLLRSGSGSLQFVSVLWCAVLCCAVSQSYNTAGDISTYLLAFCCPLFQGWCVLWCKCKISLSTWKRVVYINLTNCICTVWTHVFENPLLHYTHTSPMLAVCLWSSINVLTHINIICFLSPPGMPVDVHSGAFRLWQLQNGSSFHGCIQNLYINNELQDFTKTQMKPGVVPGCEPCKKIYCVHGICQPDGIQGPVCHCQPGWSGPHCDQTASNPCQGSKYVHKWDWIFNA